MKKKKSLKKILQIQLVLDQDSAQWELTRSVAVLALGHQLKQYPTKKKHLISKAKMFGKFSARVDKRYFNLIYKGNFLHLVKGISKSPVSFILNSEKENDY